MRRRTLIHEDKIEHTIGRIPKDAFTMLDFIATLKLAHPNEWGKLVERFGL